MGDRVIRLPAEAGPLAFELSGQIWLLDREYVAARIERH